VGRRLVPRHKRDLVVVGWASENQVALVGVDNSRGRVDGHDLRLEDDGSSTRVAR